MSRSEKDFALLLDLARGHIDEQLYRESVFQLALKEGILTRVFSRRGIAENLSGPMGKEIVCVLNDAKEKTSRQISAMKQFREEAEELSLRFAVIKGVSLSSYLYDHSFARSSNDIDILVSHRDIEKAHRVAVRSGFVQPRESFRARQLAARGDLSEQVLRGMESPFPVRNSVNAPHLAQYLKWEKDGTLTVLEIHDSYPGIAQDLIDQTLYDLEIMSVDGASFPALSSPMRFLLLLFAAHKECEGMRSNLSKGALGLKYLVDIHEALKRGVSLNDVVAIVEAYDLWRAIGEVMFDLVQVYPDTKVLIDGFFPMYVSVWNCSYIDRLLDVKKRREAVARTVSRSVEELSQKMPLSQTRRLIGVIPGKKALLQAHVRVSHGQCVLTWVSAENLFKTSNPSLLLNAAFVWVSDDAKEAIRGFSVTVYKTKVGWAAKTRALSLRSLDFHVGKRFGDDASSLLEVVRRDGMLVLRIAFPVPDACTPERSAAFFSVYEKQVAGIYSLSFGDEPVEVILRTIREETS